MNADKVNPEVEIVLGGEKYKLLLNVRACIHLESSTGISAFDSVALFKSPMKVTNLRALLWSMLIGSGTDISIEKVEELIAISEVETVIDAVVKAYVNAMPPSDSKKAKAV